MDQLTTVEKALDILFHLHACPEPQGVTAIGRSGATGTSATALTIPGAPFGASWAS